MNTAISFASNTNWQGYGGESTMSYLTQMLGLAVQNFLSAATGIAVLMAVIRGFSRAVRRAMGNFWVDMTRSTLYVLMPLSLVLTMLLVSQGVVQNFKPYVCRCAGRADHHDDRAGEGRRGPPVSRTRPATGDQGPTVTTQTLPMGPAASQIAIKHAGHQRRRFLQRQLGASVREPDAVQQFPRDAGDFADSRRRSATRSVRWSAIAAGLGDCSR
jgi:K+-transporting ATPase ATPase A chain